MSTTDMLMGALDGAVEGTMVKGDVGILFSGGLDSGVLAALARRHGVPRLYTVGIEGSYDLRTGREAAEELGLPWTGYVLTAEEVVSAARELLRICPLRDPVVLSFQLPLSIVASRCPQDVLMSGQGADELFGGYSRYLGMTPEELEMSTHDDLAKLLEEVRPLDLRIVAHFSKTIDHPYLEPAVRRVAGMIPATEKVQGGRRKVPLREVAAQLGSASLAAREKKAAQYGSGFMKVLKARSRLEGMSVSELVTALASGTV